MADERSSFSALSLVYFSTFYKTEEVSFAPKQQHTHLQSQLVVALVLHWCNQESTEVILPHSLVLPTHLQVVHKVRQLLQCSHKPPLFLKIDTEALIHWVKLVSKLQADRVEITASVGTRPEHRLTHHGEGKDEFIVGSYPMSRAAVKQLKQVISHARAQLEMESVWSTEFMYHNITNY